MRCSILEHLVSNVASPVGMTKELTAAVPLAMKTRSRSIGDEDKERMTRVRLSHQTERPVLSHQTERPVLLAPRMLSCGDRLLSLLRYKPRKLQERPRSHTARSGQEPHTPGETKVSGVPFGHSLSASTLSLPCPWRKADSGA